MACKQYNKESNTVQKLVCNSGLQNGFQINVPDDRAQGQKERRKRQRRQDTIVTIV